MARILLVEDDTPLLRLYEGALAGEHEVIGVESAAAAIKVINEDHPNLLVLDLNLPDAPGTSILSHLAAYDDFADIQVVVMTGFAYYKTQNLPDFVVQVLSKPVTISMLQRTVSAALANQAHS